MKEVDKNIINDKLTKVILGIMAGVLVALAIVQVNGSLERGYPYNSILLWAPHDIFIDFWYTYGIRFAPYLTVGLGHGYFPFMYFVLTVIGLPFIIFPPVVLLFSLLGFFIFYSIRLIKDFCKTSYKYFNPLTILIFLFSYPIWYCIERANVEMIVFIFVSLFLIFYSKKQFKKSALFLAMATATKLHPAVLSLFYLKDKKYKEFFTFVGLSTAFMIFPLFIFKPASAFIPQIKNMLENFQYFTKMYTASPLSLTGGHSLLLGAKTLGYLISKDVNIFFATSLLKPYLIIVGFIFALICYYFFCIKDNSWKKAFVLFCSLALLPHATMDYTLMYMLIPLIMFIYDDNKEKFDNIYIALFVLILIPMNWWFLELPINWWFIPLQDTNLVISVCSMMLRPFVLLAFLLLIIFKGILKNHSNEA